MSDDKEGFYFEIVETQNDGLDSPAERIKIPELVAESIKNDIEEGVAVRGWLEEVDAGSGCVLLQIGDAKPLKYRIVGRNQTEHGIEFELERVAYVEPCTIVVKADGVEVHAEPEPECFGLSEETDAVLCASCKYLDECRDDL